MEPSALLSPSRRRSLLRAHQGHLDDYAPAPRRQLTVDALEDVAFLRALEELLQQHVDELNDVDLVLGAKQINYLAFRLHEALEPKPDPETNVIQAWTIQPQIQLKIKMSSHIQVLKLSTMLREVARLRIHQQSLLRSAIEVEIFPSLRTIEVVHTEVAALRNVHFFARQLRKFRLEHTPLQSLRQLLSPGADGTRSMTTWKQLESLRINCCSLPFVDEYFNALEVVKVVDLAWNEIDRFEVPATTLSLQWLDLCHNKLSSFPSLTKLQDLKVLDLSVNQIESLRGVETLSALIDLDVSHNKLRDIHELELLTGLEALRRLVMHDNPIARRPDYRREVLFYLSEQVELDDDEWSLVELQTMKCSRHMRIQPSAIASSTSNGWASAFVSEGSAWEVTNTSMVYPILPKATDVVARSADIVPAPRLFSPKRWRLIERQADSVASRPARGGEATATEVTEELDNSEAVDDSLIQTVDDFFRFPSTDQARPSAHSAGTIDIHVDGTVEYESDSDSSSDRSRNRSRKYTESDFMRDFEEEEAVASLDDSRTRRSSSVTQPRPPRQATQGTRGVNVRVLLSAEDAAVFDLAFGMDGLAATVDIKSNEILETLQVPDRDSSIAFSRQLPDVMAVGTSTNSTRAKLIVLRLRKVDGSFGSATYQVEATSTLGRLLAPLLGHLYAAVTGHQTPTACLCSNCGGVSHFTPEYIDSAFTQQNGTPSAVILHSCLLCTSFNVREVSVDRMLAAYSGDGMPLLAKRVKPPPERRAQRESGFSVEEQELSEREALEIHSCVFIASNGIREAVSAPTLMG